MIQVEGKSAIETAQREEMRCMSRDWNEETLCVVRNTGYCAATDDIKDSSMFVECVVTKVVHLGVLNETLNQNFNRWSQSHKFIQTLIEKIVSDPRFVAPIAAIVKQLVIKAVKE